ncbi:hypothetical protein ACFQUU_03625 [Herbaspirillum sp. GCM10030257]|uniref:hypothetical protein n=1 Tax=Herbaspirillum sp. GCM10030257 TaxID=3273393 RepID=UPI00360FBC26
MSKQLIGSVVLATGFVAGGMWVADQSLMPKSAGSAFDAKNSQPVGAVDSQFARTVAPQTADNLASPLATNPSSTSSGISKCVVNGMVVYSDNGCPDGAKQQAVALHDSAGIVSPPKENLADLTAKRKAAERAYAIQAQAQVTAIGRSGQTECDELDRQVANLDSMARQPHSGTMQDWIKNERKVVRDRQFAMRC